MAGGSRGVKEGGRARNVEQAARVVKRATPLVKGQSKSGAAKAAQKVEGGAAPEKLAFISSAKGPRRDPRFGDPPELYGEKPDPLRQWAQDPAAMQDVMMRGIFDLMFPATTDELPPEAVTRVEDYSQPLPGRRGAIASPTKGMSVVETDHYIAPSWSEIRRDVAARYPRAKNFPTRKGKELGRGGEQVASAALPQTEFKDVVIKEARRPKYAVRKLHLQRILDQYKVPVLRVRDDEAAAYAAAEYGVTLQESMPKGAVSLDQIGRRYDTWGEVLDAVEKKWGKKARRDLVQIKDKIHQIDDNRALKRAAHERGYTVTPSIYGGSDYETARVIDSLGGGAWGANLYYSPDSGWFLGDW